MWKAEEDYSIGKEIIYTWTLESASWKTLGRWIASYKFSARIARNLLEVVNKVGGRV